MKQIIIPTEGHVGELADVMEALGDINLLDIDAKEDDDHGFILISVDRYDDALRRLRAAGYRPVTEDALVIRLKDEPGALAAVAKRFKEAEINLRSIHILRRRKEYVDVSLVTDCNEAAVAVVEDLVVRKS